MPSESRTFEMEQVCRIFARDESKNAAKRVLRQAARDGIVPWREAVCELTEAEADRLGRWIDGLTRVEADSGNVMRLVLDAMTSIDHARALLLASRPADAQVGLRIAIAACKLLASLAERMEREEAGTTSGAAVPAGKDRG